MNTFVRILRAITFWGSFGIYLVMMLITLSRSWETTTLDSRGVILTYVCFNFITVAAGLDILYGDGSRWHLLAMRTMSVSALALVLAIAMLAFPAQPALGIIGMIIGLITAFVTGRPSWPPRAN